MRIQITGYKSTKVRIPVADANLEGRLTIPDNTDNSVIFCHGSILYSMSKSKKKSHSSHNTLQYTGQKARSTEEIL